MLGFGGKVEALLMAEVASNTTSFDKSVANTAVAISNLFGWMGLPIPNALSVMTILLTAVALTSFASACFFVLSRSCLDECGKRCIKPKHALVVVEDMAQPGSRPSRPNSRASSPVRHRKPE